MGWPSTVDSVALYDSSEITAPLHEGTVKVVPSFI